MYELFHSVDKFVDGEEVTIASNFSSQVHNAALDAIVNAIHGIVAHYAQKNRLECIFTDIWLEECWQVLTIDKRCFLLGVFINSDNSYLQVIIKDYQYEKKCRPVSRTVKLNKNGKIKAISTKISSHIKVDHDMLCRSLAKVIDTAYRDAFVDYQAAMRDFCLAAAGDDFYDVLRKSDINSILQKDITLYCVYNGMGRHIPSLERVTTIVSKLDQGLPTQGLDPLRLAFDFFLTPLDGRKYELYTQKAFREKQTMIATSNTYTGASYVRIATEAFFKNVDVSIQPIISMGDENWLLSAIYPTKFQSIVQDDIDKLKDNFYKVATAFQSKNRNAFDKLNAMKSGQPGKSNASLLGEFFVGVVNAVIEYNK